MKNICIKKKKSLNLKRAVQLKCKEGVRAPSGGQSRKVMFSSENVNLSFMSCDFLEHVSSKWWRYFLSLRVLTICMCFFLFSLRWALSATVVWRQTWWSCCGTRCSVWRTPLQREAPSWLLLYTFKGREAGISPEQDTISLAEQFWRVWSWAWLGGLAN